VLTQASQAASAYATESVLKEEQEIIGQLRKGGVKVTQFDAAVRAEFDAKNQPMYEEFYKSAGNNGRELVKYVQSVR